MIKGYPKRVIKVYLTRKNNALHPILFVTLIFIKATSLKPTSSLKVIRKCTLLLRVKIRQSINFNLSIEITLASAPKSIKHSSTFLKFEVKKVTVNQGVL